MAFFSGNNGLFKFTGRVLDILVLSAMWVACCLPVITIGPATAALYYSCVKCLRFHEPSPYRSFWDAFRQNLKTGIGATAFALVLALLMYSGDVFFMMAAGTGERFWGMLQIAYRVFLLLPAAVLTVMFPLLSRFTFTVGGLISTSLALTVRHLPRLIPAGLISVLAFFGLLVGWYYGLMLVIPTLSTLLISLFLEPVFRKYTPKEEEDSEAEPHWYADRRK